LLYLATTLIVRRWAARGADQALWAAQKAGAGENLCWGRPGAEAVTVVAGFKTPKASQLQRDGSSIALPGE